MKINVVFLLESMLLLASFWGVWQVQFLDGLASVSRQTSIHALALLYVALSVVSMHRCVWLCCNLDWGTALS